MNLYLSELCLDMWNNMLPVFWVILHLFCADVSWAEKLNLNKTEAVMSILKGTQGSDLRAYSTATVDYVRKVVQIVQSLKCHQECGVFDAGFKGDSDKMVKILCHFPAISGLRLENTLDNFNAVTKGIKQYVSETFFNSIFIRSIYRRHDCADVDIRPLDVIPDKLLPSAYFTGASQDYQSGGSTLDFLQQSPFEGSSDTEERLMDYYREDHSMNSNHWMFHNLFEEQQPQNRAQERFGHYHRILLARYIIERRVLGISAIRPLDVQERRSTFRSFYPNNKFQSVSPTRETCTIDGSEEQSSEQLLARAVAALGASQEQFIGEVQGNYHNAGHMMLSRNCRADQNLEDAFMSDPAFAARDPLFYRWHYEVENLLKRQKNRRQYGQADLRPAAGIVIDNIQLRSRCNEPNLVETFYDTRTFPVRFGGERAGNTPITNVNERILNHENFVVSVRLINNQAQRKNVILRMFLTLDEFVDQSPWMVEMDRWVHTLSGNREEVITRRSQDSFSTDKLGLDQWRTLSETDEVRRVNCAWPRNLYLPRGRPGERTDFVLVVFVHDVAQGVNEGLDTSLPAMICGTRPDSARINYDARSFGFPFDRDWNGVDRATVLRNGNQLFGNVSTVFQIAFSESRARSCGTTRPVEPPPTAASTTTTPAPPVSGGSCPNQFLQSGNLCYFVFRQPRTYTEAQSSCASRGGRVVRNLRTSWNALQRILISVSRDLPEDTEVGFWLDRRLASNACAYTDAQEAVVRQIRCNTRQAEGFVMIAVCERPVG